jgi:hypothetical protein
MTFQAYLDAVERKTGLVPQELLDRARAKGFDGETKSREIVDWLKADFGLGRGHAMAIVHVIRHGTTISDKHVGSTGPHRDDSTELRLDGIARRDDPPG